MSIGLRYLLILASVAVIVVTGVVLIFQEIDRRAAPAIVIRDPRIDATIVVSLEGAVGTPGVYELPPGARLGQAIDAAGGVRSDADVNGMNPARTVADGERIVVPTRPLEVAPSAMPVGATPDGTRAAEPATRGPINVNTATAAELEALPGIGPVIAARIVDERTSNGPFATIDDLERVEGISRGIVEELRPYATV